MLKSLKIRNFQSHKKLDLYFGKVTSIIGPSDIGKSAVLRALLWIMENHPTGDAFIKDGTEKASVQLIADDSTIKRKRSKSQNLYTLNKEEFYAFGNKVPDPISNLFNIGDINVQRQHDSPFWFSISAGEVSRQLNSIVDLGIIDKTLATIASELRKDTWKITLQEEKIDKLQKRNKELLFVKDIKSEFDELKKTDDKAKKLNKNYDDLRSKISQAITYTHKLDRASNLNSRVQNLIKSGDLCKKLEDSFSCLSALLKDGSYWKRVIVNEPVSFVEVAKQKQQTQKLEKRIESLKPVLTAYIEGAEKINQTQKVLKIYKKELEKCAGEKCPVCKGTGQITI